MNYEFSFFTVKLCLEWIRLKPTVLEEAAFTSRLQIWPSLCVLLNGLQTCVSDFKYDQCKFHSLQKRAIHFFINLY